MPGSIIKDVKRSNTYHKTHPFCMTQRLVGTASMRSMTFLQVDRCSNEPFSTYCVYCVFYKLILRILRILQIVILEYCVYCVFYKLTSANIAYIAYIAYIALRILRNIALRCVAYFTTSRSRMFFSTS